MLRCHTTLLGLLLVVMSWVGQEPPTAMAYDIDTPDIVTQNPTFGIGGLYVIQGGDNLWDLCTVFFHNPYKWPTMWSWNPQVTNPHWIYPGDVLRMQPPVQRGADRTVIWSESRYSDRKVFMEILSRYVGYLPDRKFKHSGKIIHARESHDTLAEYDEIYLAFKKDMVVRRGEKFTIYRNLGPVMHPTTEKIVGHKVKHLGIAKVLDAKNDYVKALILKSYEEIYRGDLITSIFPHSFDVGPVLNQVDLQATLVDYYQPTRFAGQLHYVYIDKGRLDGLKRGNRFVIQRRGDGLWFDDPPEDAELDKFPWERMGEVMVVEVFEENSLGIVTQSIKELVRGDRLLMTKGY